MGGGGFRRWLLFGGSEREANMSRVDLDTGGERGGGSIHMAGAVAAPGRQGTARWSGRK